jgi:hypothetical protein
MTEFTFLFRGRDYSGSPKQMQEYMMQWMAWFKSIEASGNMKDPGHPLEKEGKVVRGKQKTINDGPFAEAKDLVAGFIVVLAKDLNHAAEIASGCPILEVGGSVEVRQNQKLNY